ncbi:UNVERIFIED_CONTAM: Ribosomal RNA small subunit methyltransferase NEP1 [Sesamum latifolium]|uniref:Ribosomal RNA small subunit methyltransferase NEP1 n=1 Tax=Sesamum latifolium TaxID=2727402 RepID=A0AAW2VG79_9LAMI
MGRAYKMKGQKRKKKEEKYDREEEIEQLDEKENPPSPKKVKTEGSESEKVEEMEPVIDEMPGNSYCSGGHGYFVVYGCVIVYVGQTYQLLSSDEHANYLTKISGTLQIIGLTLLFSCSGLNNKAGHNNMFFKLDFIALQALALASPSVDFLMSIPYFNFNQAIQTILDSRVNKSGRLKALYVRTQQGLLLEIKPHARMPRTYKRFSGLMVQLLQKLHITAAGKGEKLLRVIKNPVTQYLPINSRKIGFSHSSEKLVDMYNYVGTINNDLDLVFVVGAMSHGKIEDEYVEDYISISEYPLSAAYCISIVTTALERKWKIL